MDPIQPHAVTIREHTFYIRRFPAFEAMEVLGDLQRQFAGPLMGGLQPKAGGSEIMMAGLAKLSADLDGRKLRAWAERLLHPDTVAVSVDGAEAVKLSRQMVEKCGLQPDEIIHLCLEVVKHNFQGFSTRWSGLISSGLSLLAKGQQENSAQP